MVLLTTSRSPRDVAAVFSKTTTGPDIGPDRYECQRWGDGELDCKSPGLGLGDRPPMHEWYSKEKNPGPGSYYTGNQEGVGVQPVAQPYRRNPPGAAASAFRSQTSRISADNLREPLLVPGSSEFMVSTVADNPGPGEYEAPRGLGERRRPATSAGVEDRSGKAAAAAILHQTAPSIPQLRDLQRQRYSGRPQDSVAPCDYEQSDHGAMRSSIAHQGASTDFHSSTGDRFYQKDEGRPGPGAYSVNGRLRRGTSMPFLSETPQLHTAQPVVTSSCSPALTPGPGEYPAASCFQLPEDEDKPTAFAGMSSTTQRGGWWRSLEHPFTERDSFAGRVPAPTHYAGQASGLKELTKHRRVRSSTQGLSRTWHGVHSPQQLAGLRDSDGSELAGFSCSASRPCLANRKAEQSAGPATYDPSLSMGQSVSAKLRDAIKIGKGGAFGGSKTGDRFAHGVLANKKGSMPAPHDYGLAMRRCDVLSICAGGDSSGGAFRSKTPQLAVVGVDRTPKPGPGAYDLPAMGREPASPLALGAAATPSPRGRGAARDLGRSVSEPSFSREGSMSPVKSRPKFKQPKTEHLCFGAGSSRQMVLSQAMTKTPAPGTYNPRVARARGGGTAITTADRGLEPPAPEALEGDPAARRGPGAYEVQGSLLQRTFNTSGERAAQILLQHAARISAAAAKRTPPAHSLLSGSPGTAVAA